MRNMSKNSNNQTKKVYGWYSPFQHKMKKNIVSRSLYNKSNNSDCYIYLDEYGNEVICTQVSSTNITKCKLNDMICLGLMTKWIRNDVKPIQNVSQLAKLEDIIVNF